MPKNFVWTDIRPIDNSTRDGFEEFICQLARREKIKGQIQFIRKGKPDAGVECYWILDNKDEIAWQAKFFTTSLTNNQWGDLDSSVKTTLKKHPNLKEYIITLPIDPADARIDNQDSLQDKWNERVKKWFGWAEDKGMSVKFSAWWSSDMISKIQQPGYEGFQYFWFNKEEFTDKFFNSNNMEAIENLGKRYISKYNPELNVDLEISKVFNGISRNNAFRDIWNKLFERLFEKFRDINCSYYRRDETSEKFTKKTQTKQDSISEGVNNLHSLFKRIEIKGTQKIDTQSLLNILSNIRSTTNELFDILYQRDQELKKEKGDKYYARYNSERYDLQLFGEAQNYLVNFLESKTIQFSNNPFMLLYGKAGKGKSHLLGDIVNNRAKNGQLSLFFLGQQFTTRQDPWTQMFSRLKFHNLKENDFLDALNSKAELKQERIIIFIDALNEGEGKHFWNNELNGFIGKIKQYEWLSLVLSVRTDYLQLIVPEEEFENELIYLEHQGFDDMDNAIEVFFNNYNIDLPNTPIFNPEFQTPLFLLLFCESLEKKGLNSIPQDLGFTKKIFDFILKVANDELAKKLDYSQSLDLVNKALYALIETKKENLDKQHFTYDEAFLIIQNAIKPFTNEPNFLDRLISENILTKNPFGDRDESYEGVYITYDRLENYITAKYLIDTFPNLRAEIANGMLNHLDELSGLYFGLYKALAIQLPEKKGIEIFELFSSNQGSDIIIHSFLDSLKWRPIETIKPEVLEYINKHILSNYYYSEFFWDTIIACSTLTQNCFNANLLHRNLLSQKMPKRDAWWCQFLKNEYSANRALTKLVDWAYSEKDRTHVSDESIELACITLAWFHACTNNQLRDYAMKGMVCLLQHRIPVLLKILKKFETVDDPYIYERLFAVAYGCATRTKQKEHLRELSEYIYTTIFDNKEEIYPHILLREYAIGVILFTEIQQIELPFEAKEVLPPYKSKWDEKSIPNLKDLEKLYDSDEYKDIIRSVTLDDFSKDFLDYRGSRKWNTTRIGKEKVDIEQLYEMFKGKLSTEQLEKLNALNPIISEDSGMIIEGMKGIEGVPDIPDTKIMTIIDRKSEEELLSLKKVFKTSLSKELLEEYEQQFETLLNHNHEIINTAEYFDPRMVQAYIIQKVIDLGWNPKLHLEFDNSIDYMMREPKAIERIGKKYQWIAYYDYVARMSDNFEFNQQWDNSSGLYKGTWDLGIRNIDPTCTAKQLSYKDDDKFLFPNTNLTFNDWGGSIKEWLDRDNLIDYKRIIQTSDDDKEWFSLEMYFTFQETLQLGADRYNTPQKQYWNQLKGYLVPEEDYVKLITFLSKQNFMGDWMPKSQEMYRVFEREFYWHQVYEDNKYESIDEEGWQYISNKNSDYTPVGKVIVPLIDYRSERGLSYNNSSFSMYKPSKELFEGLKLKYTQKTGEYCGEEGNIICKDPSVHSKTKSCLLVEKNALLKFLKSNKLRIFWTILGEKQILNRAGINEDLEKYYVTINKVFVLDECNNVVEYPTEK